MKLILWLWLGWLVTMSVQASSPPSLRPRLVADEGLQGHLDYLGSRLKLGQFAAMDSLLATLAVGQREYLLYQLLMGLKLTTHPEPKLLAWVRSKAAKAPQWLVEGEVNGFLVQQPAYDFVAAAQLVLNHWQQLAWQDNYRQLLTQDGFEFKQLYHRRNHELVPQQQALLAVLDQQPDAVVRREAHRLATLNLFLPDNRLLLHLVERTGEPALYQKLWRQPADESSVAALHTIPRFYRGLEASELLIAACRNSELKIPAMHQLSQLSPLPDRARQFLLAELDSRRYGGLLASLLLRVNESSLLTQLANSPTRQEQPQLSPVMLPDTGTTAALPGL